MRRTHIILGPGQGALDWVSEASEGGALQHVVEHRRVQEAVAWTSYPLPGCLWKGAGRLGREGGLPPRPPALQAGSPLSEPRMNIKTICLAIRVVKSSISDTRPKVTGPRRCSAVSSTRHGTPGRRLPPPPQQGWGRPRRATPFTDNSASFPVSAGRAAGAGGLSTPWPLPSQSHCPQCVSEGSQAPWARAGRGEAALARPASTLSGPVRSLL